MTFKIRLMVIDDLIAIEQIQAEAYGDYFLESVDVIEQRFRTSPTTVWVAEKEGRVCAYLVSYLSKLGKVNPLNSLFNHYTDPNCLYLHDLALSTEAQGYGLAKQLVHFATEYALNHRMTSLALLSVQNSRVFWQNIGFSEFDNLDAAQKANLEGYLVGKDKAFYMVKSLQAQYTELNNKSIHVSANL